jgi:monothiol glutaredoxin
MVTQEEVDNMKKQIDTEVNDNAVVLFMKGTPEEPLCGFSANVVDVLAEYNVNFKSFNVLEDDIMRQSIKDYSNWPTIPQLYVNAEFIGGSDIVMQLHESDELTALFKLID